MKTLPRFLRLVLLFSLPLWLAASFVDATKIIPVKLPLSALQFLAVLLAAVIAMQRSGGSVRELPLRGVDLKRIPSPLWRVGIFVLMPLTVALSYLLNLWNDATIADKMTPLFSTPLFLLIYGISGYCEEIGWTAMMSDELLKRSHTILMTGLMVGLTWAVWHLIPFLQTHNATSWIVWQSLFTILFRILLTKVYVLTNHSVFSTIAMHVTYNTAFSLLPYYGSSYNPAYMALATFCPTLVVFMLSDCSRFR